MKSFLSACFLALIFLPDTWGMRQSCKSVTDRELRKCFCYDDPDNQHYNPNLFCENLDSVDDLKFSLDVLRSSGTRLRALYINATSLPFLQGGLFKKFPLKEIVFTYTKLLSIQTPENDFFQGVEDSLEVFRITENPFARGWDLSVFSHLKKLKSLEIVNGDMVHVSKEQMDVVPKTIEMLSLTKNQIEEIEDNAFLMLNMKYLDLSFNRLKTLPDNSIPSSAEIVSFAYNQIESIPVTFLDELHMLGILNLESNNIKTLDRRSFELLEQAGEEFRLKEIVLRNNPLDCCTFSWIVDSDVKYIVDGACESPPELKGRSIRYLLQIDKAICRQ